MDPVVLSYQDSLLRRSDVALLDGPHWLNDQVIGFAFEYIETECFTKLGEKVCFISPEVAQFIKFSTCQKELAVFLEPLRLEARQWIFLPVNDNSNESAGGFHWSLLLFQRDTNRFTHYDSQTGINSLHARQIAATLEACLGPEGKVAFVEEQCPLQKNSYDCGMYVICHAEALCESVRVEGHAHLPTQMITPRYITQKRAEWCSLISRLSKE